MKRFVYPALLVLVLLSSCSTLAPAPPTSTPAPTATLPPTETPLPTDTPTPVPTSTPDKTATAAAQSTETSDAILSELDGVLGDSDILHEDGHLAWKQAKPMTVSLSGPDSDYMEVDQDLVAENFILKSDITWEASGIILCGFIFRSEPNLEEGKQYQFTYLRLSGLPAWDIEFFDFGRFKNSPTGIEYSNAIDQANGATNQVILVAQDGQFTLYLNRARQGQYFDNSKQSTGGSFAFRGSQDSGTGSCKFENSWIWALE